jgi:hypothetical protein
VNDIFVGKEFRRKSNVFDMEKLSQTVSGGPGALTSPQVTAICCLARQNRQPVQD